MSLVTDSPVHSSNSDDFAAFLDGELASTCDTSPDVEDEDWDGDEDEDVGEMGRIKRQKVEVPEGLNDHEGSTSQLDAEQILEASVKEDVCTHPGFIRGLCMICGQKVDYDDSSVQKYDTSVALKYIHKEPGANLADRDVRQSLVTDWLEEEPKCETTWQDLIGEHRRGCRTTRVDPIGDHRGGRRTTTVDARKTKKKF